MKDDLFLMFRVLLFGCFVWLTLAFPLVFVIAFWLILLLAFIVGWQEHKAKKIPNLQDKIDKLYKERGTPFDEPLPQMDLGDDFPEPHMDKK